MQPVKLGFGYEQWELGMAMDWAGMAWVRINGVDTAGGINHLCDFLMGLFYDCGFLLSYGWQDGEMDG